MRSVRRFGCAIFVLMPLAATPAHAATGSQVFQSTGAEQQFTVPAGVGSVNVELVGGDGGYGYNLDSSTVSPGGVGATAVAVLAVHPGELLFVEVGVDGAAGSTAPPDLQAGNGAGGFNGGGAGAAPTGNGGGYNASGGGGGGASDVRTCSISAATAGQPAACAGERSLGSRLVVAAGGGGGGGEGSVVVYGGAGGPAGAAGGDGQSDMYGDVGGTGGGPGGPSSGGTPGGNSDGSIPAGMGSLGTGGLGGGDYAGGGGGGGGGIYGGGGGGSGTATNPDLGKVAGGGGGGGGSSGVPAGATGVSGFSTESTAAGAGPSVTLTWTLPAPSARTGVASKVTTSSASLSGTVNPDGSLVTSCHFTLSAGLSTRQVPCEQQVGSGGVPVPVSAAVSGLRTGVSYKVELVATSAQGTGTGAAITVESAPADTHLVVRPGHFRPRSRGRHPKGGAVITYLDSEPGTSLVTVSLLHKRIPTVVERFAHTDRAGANKLTFSGRVRGHALKPGGYTVRAVPTNGVGEPGTAITATFKIVK